MHTSLFKRCMSFLLASSIVLSAIPVLQVNSSADTSTTVSDSTMSHAEVLADVEKRGITGDTNQYNLLDLHEEKTPIELVDTTGFDKWDGTFDSTFLSTHSGTADDPIIISSAEELMYLAAQSGSDLTSAKALDQDLYAPSDTTVYRPKNFISTPTEVQNLTKGTIENILGTSGSYSFNAGDATEAETLNKMGYYTVTRDAQATPTDFSLALVSMNVQYSEPKSVTIGTETTVYHLIESYTVTFRKTSTSDPTDYTDYTVDITDGLRDSNARYFTAPSKTYYSSQYLYELMNEPALYTGAIDAVPYSVSCYARYRTLHPNTIDYAYNSWGSSAKFWDMTKYEYMYLIKYSSITLYEQSFGYCSDLGIKYNESWTRTSLDGLTTEPSGLPSDYLSNTEVQAVVTHHAPVLNLDYNLSGIADSSYPLQFLSKSASVIAHDSYDMSEYEFAKYSTYEYSEGTNVADLHLTDEFYLAFQPAVDDELGAHNYAYRDYAILNSDGQDISSTSSAVDTYKSFVYYWLPTNASDNFENSLDFVVADLDTLSAYTKPFNDSRFLIKDVYFTDNNGRKLNVDWQFISWDGSVVEDGTSSADASAVSDYLYNIRVSRIYNFNTLLPTLRFSISSRSDRLNGTSHQDNVDVEIQHTMPQELTLDKFFDVLTVSGRTIGDHVPYRDVESQLQYLGRTSSRVSVADEYTSLTHIKSVLNNKLVYARNQAPYTIDNSAYQQFMSQVPTGGTVYIRLAADIDMILDEGCHTNYTDLAEAAGIPSEYALANLFTRVLPFNTSYELDLAGHTLVTRYGALSGGNAPTHIVKNGTLVGADGAAYVKLFDRWVISSKNAVWGSALQFSDLTFYDLGAAFDDPYYGKTYSLIGAASPYMIAGGLIARNCNFYISGSLSRGTMMYDCNVKFASHLFDIKYIMPYAGPVKGVPVQLCDVGALTLNFDTTNRGSVLENVEIDFDTTGSFMGDMDLWSDYTKNVVLHPHNHYLGGLLNLGPQINDSVLYYYADYRDFVNSYVDRYNVMVLKLPKTCFNKCHSSYYNSVHLNYFFNSYLYLGAQEGHSGLNYLSDNTGIPLIVNSTLELNNMTNSQAIYFGGAYSSARAGILAAATAVPVIRDTRVLTAIDSYIMPQELLNMATSVLKTPLQESVFAGIYSSTIKFDGKSGGYGLIDIEYGAGLFNSFIEVDNLAGAESRMCYNDYWSAVDCYVHVHKSDSTTMAVGTVNYNCVYEVDEYVGTVDAAGNPVGNGAAGLFASAYYNAAGYINTDAIIHKVSGYYPMLGGSWLDSNIYITFDGELNKTYYKAYDTPIGPLYAYNLSRKYTTFGLRGSNCYFNFAETAHGILGALCNLRTCQDSLIYVGELPDSLEIFEDCLLLMDSYYNSDSFLPLQYIRCGPVLGFWTMYANLMGLNTSAVNNTFVGTIIAGKVNVHSGVPVFSILNTIGVQGWHPYSSRDYANYTPFKYQTIDVDADNIDDYYMYVYTHSRDISVVGTNIVANVYINPEHTYSLTGIASYDCFVARGVNETLNAYNKGTDVVADVPVYGLLSSYVGYGSYPYGNYEYAGATMFNPAAYIISAVLLRSNAINGNSCLVANYVYDITNSGIFATANLGKPVLLSDCYLYLPNAPTSVDLTDGSVNAALPGLLGEYKPHGWGYFNESCNLAIMAAINSHRYLIDNCYVGRGQSETWRAYQSEDNLLPEYSPSNFAAVATKPDVNSLYYLNFYTLPDMLFTAGDNTVVNLATNVPDYYTTDLCNRVLDALQVVKDALTNKQVSATSTEIVQRDYLNAYYTEYYDTTVTVDDLVFNIRASRDRHVNSTSPMGDWYANDLDACISKWGNLLALLSSPYRVLSDTMKQYIDGDLPDIFEFDIATDTSGELAYRLDNGDDLYLRHGYFTVIEPDTYIVNPITGKNLYEIPCQTWAMSKIRTNGFSKNANLKPIYKTSVRAAEHGSVTLKGLNGTKTTDGEIYTKQDTYIVDSVTTDSADVLLAYAFEEVGEGAPVPIESTPLPVGVAANRLFSTGTLSKLVTVHTGLSRDTSSGDSLYSIDGYQQPAMNTTITPVFKTKRYIDVQVTNSEHGTIIPSTYVSYEGEEIHISYDCDTGYIVQNIKVNGTPLTSEMFFMPGEDVTITGDCVPFEGGITKFTLLGQNGIIDQIAGTIDVTVPRSIYLSNALPFIDYYGDYIAPDEYTRVDFSNAEDTPVTYTVHYGDSQTKEYLVTVHQTRYTQRIHDFVLNGVHGRIDQANKKITVILPTDTDVSNIAPDDISYSAETITPAIDAARDFTIPQTYTLNTTGMTPVQYTVYVQTAAPNDAYITDFVVSGYTGVIDETKGTITFEVPTLVQFDNIAPSLIKYVGRSISPVKTEYMNLEESPTYTVTANSGKTRNYTIIVNHIGDSEAHIDTFKLAGEDGVIDQVRKIITVTLPPRTNVAGVAPDELTYTGKSIYPRVSDLKDFSDDTNPVTYTVIAPDNTEVTYTVRVLYEDEEVLNNEALLLQYGVEGYTGIIDQTSKTVTLTFPSTIDVTNAIPDVFVVSQGATSNPTRTVRHDYHDDFTYIITSEDGTVRNTYTVHSNFTTRDVPNPPRYTNSDALLIEYGVNGYKGIINQDTKVVTLSFPNGVDVTNAVPDVFVISDGATANPSKDIMHDYHSDFTYAITSEDGSKTNVYTVHSEFPKEQSEDARIIRFAIDEYEGTIDQTTGVIVVHLPADKYTPEDISNKVPSITWIGRDIDPDDTAPQNFNNKLTYVVTAENPAIKKAYDVFVIIDTNEDKPWYNIILEDDPHGDIDSSIPKAHEGDPVTIWITPDPGYEPESFTIDGTEELPQVQITFPMPPHDVTARVEFSEIPVYYNIIIDSSLNGTVTSTHTKATEGTTVTVTAKPNTDCEIVTFKVDGTEQLPNTSDTFSMPPRDVHVTAEFKHIEMDKPKYKIILEDDPHGDIDSSVLEAYEGEEVKIWVTPDDGYVPKTFIVDGDEELPKTEVTIVMPPRDVTASVEFTEKLYKLITEDTEHGQIIPSVPEAPEGEDVWVEVIPDPGYKPETFTVDDKEQLPAYKVYFKMPPRDVYANVEFTEILYHIIVDQNDHGKVISTHEWAPAGEIVKITLIPDDGYEPTRFDIDKDNKLPNLEYSFPMPPRDVTVTVRFTEIEEDDDGFPATGVTLGITVPLIAAGIAFATRKRKKK